MQLERELVVKKKGSVEEKERESHGVDMMKCIIYMYEMS